MFQKSLLFLHKPFYAIGHKIKSSKMTKAVFTLWMLIIPTMVYCQSGDLPEVAIRDTEVRQIKSDTVEGMTYEIHIALPANYSKMNEEYPVVYYLDAYYWGGIVIETYRLLRAFNEIPPLILVGISYPDATVAEAHTYRSRDFIPTEVNEQNMGEFADAPPPASGGANKFLAFMKEELKPLIEKNYRVNKEDSGILGYSNGALFGAYVLFHDPSTFNNYLLGSPALDLDNFVTLKYEEEYFSKSKELKANVFLSAGTEEWERIIVSWLKLKNRLEIRNYEGLNLIVKAFEGENHTSNIPGTISRGFRELYGRK